MTQEIIRTERHMRGNKAVQKTTYSDGQNEAMGGMIILGLIVLVILSPFAVLLWIMYVTVALVSQQGGPPMLGIVLAVLEAAGIFGLFLADRIFRYVYIVLNAIIIAHLTYNALSDHGQNVNGPSVIAAVLLLGALIGGILGERQLDRVGLPAFFNQIRNL